jgi:DNA-binding CsgD family transcriptional regulator
LSVLLGRHDDLSTLTSALNSALDDLSAVVVVRGEAGMGKSTLVEHVVSATTGFDVVTVTGIQSEMELPFAALHRLLLPLLPGIEALPRPQHLALATTFGLLPGPAPDQFLVSLATLSLLAGSARERPLLCVVDDAQWLDHASTSVLTFVARRLLADRIVMFFCVRDQAADDLTFVGLPELRLRGLTPADAQRLLEDLVESVDPHVARLIVAEAGGNPLAVIEFAGQLTPEELSGERWPGERLPVSRRIENLYQRQIHTLPPAARTVLLLASADPSGDPELLWRAVTRLGVADEEATDAHDAVRDFVTFRPSVVFRHPLVRSAVYRGASAVHRRQAHGALADVLGDTSDRDRRSWHLAAAAAGPDEDTAVHLEHSAGRARGLGGYSAESAFLARAAELTPGPQRKGDRLLAAAEAALRAGEYRRCQALLAQADPLLVGGRSSAEAARLRGACLPSLGRIEEAPAALTAAALALGEFDPSSARETWAGALSTAWLALDQVRGTTLREVAATMLAATPDEQPVDRYDALCRGVAIRVAVDYPTAVPVLRQAITTWSNTERPSSGVTFGAMLVFLAAQDLWDVDSGRRSLLRMAEQERARGGLVGLWVCLLTLSHLERRVGRLATAQAHQQETTAVADMIGLGGVLRFPGVEMYAFLGWDADLATALATARATTAGTLLGAPATAGRLALAVHALSRGRYRDAYDHARAAFDEDAPVFGNEALPDLVEAATRVGLDDAVEAPLRRLTERAQASGTDWALGLLARSRALVASPDDAEPHYQEAVRMLQSARVPLDLARAHLLYGEWLRRRKRDADAVEQLRRAHDMFSSMGARGFADRADIELRALGMGPTVRRAVSRDRSLTSQEEQVARLAAGGMTNREIAASLFVSESTAAYHLKKVFRKLGLSSRRELRQLGLSYGTVDGDEAT